ncbi:unnamed protein product [Scytosiphon promiscuus]
MTSIADGSTQEDDLERKHFMEVRHAFLEYSDYMQKELDRARANIKKLPPSQGKKLSAEFWQLHDRKLEGIRDGIARNQAFLDAVVEFQDSCSPFPLREDDNRAPGDPSKTTATQVSKINTTLRQCMRDWSDEGERERDSSYAAVISELERLCPVKPDTKVHHKVLVPGAGAGRLAYEIVSRGYGCAGNEFSYFMLMVSNFFLNGAVEANQFVLSPFVDNKCNTVEVNDMLRTVRVPDVCPPAVLEEDLDFSYVSGEWLACYEGQASVFDAIVTVFFLDTAPVVVEYVEAIARLLKEGGVWINHGPLLFHWSDSSLRATDERFQRSIELSWEEIRHVCASYGLEIVREERHDATYNADERSMMKTAYSGILCSAVKRSSPEGGGKP